MPGNIFPNDVIAATIVIILFWCGVATGILATNQGRRFWVWFVVGFALGPVGVLITLKVIGIRPRPPLVECLSCGRRVRTREWRCPACGKPLAGRQPDQAAKVGREAAAGVFLVRRAFLAARQRRQKGGDK